MQLTDGRDRLNACNYDWPRKGPIAIVRSAARRGADRTARARCVQQTNINSFNFCLPGGWWVARPLISPDFKISLIDDRDYMHDPYSVSAAFVEQVQSDRSMMRRIPGARDLELSLIHI